MHSKLMFMLIIHSIWVRTVVGVLNIQAGLLGQFSVKSTVKSNFFFFDTGQLDTLQVYKISDTA